MQPLIDIALVASPFCFLNREGEFFIYLKYKLHYQEPITINSLGSIFDPAAAFSGNGIQILDTVTKEAVRFKTVPDTSAKEKQDHSFVLKPEVESYFFWTTSTQPLRWREHPFDISGLMPDHKYTIVYCAHGISQWYSGSHSTLEEERFIADAQPGDSIQVNLIGDPHPHFTARQAMRPAPPLTASISFSTPTCSLSATPPFTVSVDWTLNSGRAIYALITCEEGRNIGLEIRDPEKNGRRIGPPPDLPPEDDDITSSNDEDIFVSLDGLGECFSQAYTLATEERRDGLVRSDTWNLKSGRGYEITIRKSKWRWLYQDEVEGDERQNEAKVLEILWQESYSEFKPECRAEFHTQ